MSDTNEQAVGVESQASQILENIMGGAGSAWKPNVSSQIHAEDDSGGSRDVSSNASSARSSAPRYHFHGLAATQTQSQYEDHPGNEGSQKENTPTSAENQTGLSPIGQQSSSVSSSSSKSPNKVSSHVDSTHPPRSSTEYPSNTSVNSSIVLDNGPAELSDPPRNPFNDKVPLSSRPPKAVAFLSPNTSAPPSNANRQYKRTLSAHRDPHRSSLPASQDSFAGPLPEPDKVFLATSRQFDIPLSELGLASTQCSASEDTASAAPRGRERHRREASAMFAPELRRVPSPTKIRSVSPGHEETVLVAATPSNSGSSQDELSQNSLWGNSQDLNMYPNAQPIPDVSMDDFDVTDSVANEPGNGDATQPLDDSPPSSDDYRVLLPSAVPASQLSEYQATQPTSDGGDTSHDFNDASETPQNANQERNGHIQYSETSATTSKTGPRSILSMVDPKKRYRYQGAADAGGVAQGSRFPATPVREHFVPETQPSELDSSARTTDQLFGSLHITPDVHRHRVPVGPVSPFRHREIPRRTEDALEVVPDSEPPRAEARDSTPAAYIQTPILSNRITDLSSPKRNARSTIPQDSEDFVSDSLLGPGAENKEDDAEDDDEEDEVPLASAVASKQRRGKQTRNKQPPRSLFEAGGPEKATNVRPKRIRDHTDIPPSAPERNLDTSGARPARSAVAKGKMKAPSAAAGESKRDRSASKTPALGNNDQESDTEGSEYEHSAPAVQRNIAREEEEETELADNDWMDLDEEAAPLAPSSRKRKRPNTRSKSRAPPSRVSTTKASKASVAGKASLATPAVARSAKRPRTGLSASRGWPAEPTRVFALWRQDGHYYPGVIQSTYEASRYTVNFDDDTQDVVDISKMRYCQLNEGDNVILMEGNQKARVMTVQDHDADGLVTVEVDNGDELEQFDVPLREIRIASRTLTSQWKDRIIDLDSIVTVEQPKLPKTSPSPSKLSVVSGASVGANARSKALSKIGLVVTVSKENTQLMKDKDKIASMIRNYGGTVIDDWSNVISMEGKFSSFNRRWVACQEDVQWTGKGNVEKVFLLSDDATFKPKFLIALALGVPCLSIDWLYDRINQKGSDDWQPYLLPAGYCEAYDARVSQMVDLNWGNSIVYIHEITSNPVASKLFDEKSILCLGDHFVPFANKTSKKGSSEEVKAKEANSNVPRIILAMGAARVEAVSEAKFASQRNLSAFDYIVVKELSDVAAIAEDGVTCVHVHWIKDSLIAGRLLPLPQ